MTRTLNEPRGRAKLPASGPRGVPRLLAGWYEDRGPASLRFHATRYGDLPRLARDRAARLIDELEASGLAGRGGAGFPTHRKLRAVRASRRAPVVIANGMEGEPAAAKDRLLLAVAPHLVLDGATLAAEAVGADVVHICVPRGQRSTRPTLEHAIQERRDAGYSSIPFHVEELPEHYVAGEERSLVRWLNGGPALPTTAPPRPFERGVAGRSTLVQNVETLAQLALIARFGAPWFRQVGTTEEPGSLLLSVTLPDRPIQVLEVAIGTPIGQVARACEIVREPQAVLVGGYFGSWLPYARAATLPLTHADLRLAGGGLGAGVVAFLPTEACGLCETARVARYLADQSARQCGPCSLGLPAVARDLALLCHGRDAQARERAIGRMRAIEGRGACRHPDGTVRLVRSALEVFAEHAAWHASNGPCAGMHRAPMLPIRSAPPVRE